ncbi:hypothetical protein l11_13930 [Neisseria weaveri LMG 5135]|nr:hypothetical protein l11_13930 [Neisseria weaveri LMG 5135]
METKLVLSKCVVSVECKFCGVILIISVLCGLFDRLQGASETADPA